MLLLRSVNPALGISSKLSKYGGRRFIVDPEACQSIINKLNLREKYPNNKNLTILDVFTGEGSLSSMINYELKPKKHYIIEKFAASIKYWKERIELLENKTNNVENFELIERDGHNWQLYDDLITQGKISNEIKSRDSIHSEILLLANLTIDRSGESLCAQWIMCCGHRNWLQRFGRVRMILLVQQDTAAKFLSGPKFFRRNKSAVKFDLLTDSKFVAISPSDSTIDRYDPNVIFKDQPVLVDPSSTRPVKSELCLIEVEPNNETAKMIDECEPLLRALFIGKSKPLRATIHYVAFGANEYFLKVLPDYILDKAPTAMLNEDWHIVFEAWDNWAFKPEYADKFDMVEEN